MEIIVNFIYVFSSLIIRNAIMKLVISILTFIGLLTACSNSRQKEISFPVNKKLTAEKIHINEIFSADFVTQAGDFFIISSSLSDTTLFLYETPTLTFKNATGKRGGGPEDIQTFPMFCHTMDSNFLYIRGYSPYSIRKIALDSIGNFSFVDEYLLKQHDEYNFMNIIKDSLFIYYNSNELGIKKYDLKNNESLGEIKFPKDDHRESFYFQNRGLISANDSFVVHPYIYKKQIDIYSVDNFKLHKRISDGKHYPKPSIQDPENITYHYFNVYAGEKYFYALYVGHKEHENFLDRTLEVYDYEGNPIIRYTFDIVPFYFAVDEKRGYIYATNSNYEDYLLRYRM